MKRFVQCSLLTLTLAAGVAVANSGADSDEKFQQRVEKLSESLGLEPEAAWGIVETIHAAKEQKKALRSQVKEEGVALSAALEAGDEKGMVAAMDNIESIREELRAVKAQTRKAIEAELTIEQQAKVTLRKMKRKKRKAPKRQKGKQKSQ